VLSVFRQTDGFNVRRHPTGIERQQLVAGLGQTQLPRQYVEDRGPHVEDYQYPVVADDDSLDARRMSRAWSRVSGAGNRQLDHGTKKWQHVDARRRYDVDNFGNQYDVIDQIGSNIIRRK